MGVISIFFTLYLTRISCGSVEIALTTVKLLTVCPFQLSLGLIPFHFVLQLFSVLSLLSLFILIFFYAPPVSGYSQLSLKVSHWGEKGNLVFFKPTTWLIM